MSETDRPAPLVSPEVDLRDFGYMPLDALRLRDSDLALGSADVFRASVLLWCASWHQVPAGSLPNKDPRLADFAKSAACWRRVRGAVLAEWVLCSDDRLYHPVVAEKAREAWRSKLEQRWRTECSRIKKHNQRHNLTLPVPEFELWLSQGCPQGHALFVPEDKSATSPGQGQGQIGENGSKGREGKGREGKGLKKTPPNPPEGGGLLKFPPGFERFWEVYPNKSSKDAAVRAFARRRFTPEMVDRVIAAVVAQKTWEKWTKNGGEFIPHASTWINGGCWDDEPMSSATGAPASLWERAI